MSTATLSPQNDVRLTRGQWLVLAAAMLGWLFDGYELGLFPVIGRPALQNLLGAAGTEDNVTAWIGWITACFLIGAAAGGTLFGFLGDRIGRVRAMGLSILTYSLVTGIGYFVRTPFELGVIRAISSLGMGGQWALGVALVMECWPEKWRPMLAGLMGAASNVGFLLVAFVALGGVSTEHWRWMMLVAALPSLLVIFVLGFTPESERWRSASRGEKQPLLREVFGPHLISRTLLGIAFASIALIGTWGSVQWLPSWADQMAGATDHAAKAYTSLVSSVGAIFGALGAPFVGAMLGRRPAYFLLCLSSFLLCGILFHFVHSYGAVFLFFTFMVGGSTATFYGWFPLYFPELFPTRVRATAQGTCFNSGRVLAAVGAVTAGQLVGLLGNSYARAGAIVTLVYLIGMALIWVAPETKGKPLPD
jgi:MFS family permease